VDGRVCYVRALPISIDTETYRDAATVPGAEDRIQGLRARYGVTDDVKLGVGVDRIDYSKGLEEKLKALEIFFDTFPQYRQKLTYVQIAVPSRTGIDAYDWLNEKLGRMVWAINDRLGTESWRPVHLLKESLPLERLALYYRAADLCIVGSLQDGMNLVAKEYIACQVDEPPGVLVLSQFAGAAAELDGAYEVNPFDPDMFANALAEVMQLSDHERSERMRRLRGTLRTIFDWMAEVFQVWGAVAGGGAAPLSEADRWSRLR
jgi:trehalose 6-phosphate synthase